MAEIECSQCQDVEPDVLNIAQVLDAVGIAEAASFLHATANYLTLMRHEVYAGALGEAHG